MASNSSIFINQIRGVERSPRVVGIYRLGMKAGSDNFRESSVQAVMQHLIDRSVELVIFEPDFTGIDFEGTLVVRDFAAFAAQADVIGGHLNNCGIISSGLAQNDANLFKNIHELNAR